MDEETVDIGGLTIDLNPQMISGSWFHRTEREHVDGRAAVYNVSGPHSLQIQIHYIELIDGTRWVMAGENFVGPKWIHTQINDRLRMSVNIKNGVPMFDLTLPTPKKRNPKIFTSSKASKDELSRVLPDFEPVLFKYGGIKINTRGNMFDDKSSRKGFLSLSLKDADCLAPIIGFCITRILPLIQIHEEMLVSKVIEENILDMSVGKTSNSTDGKTTLSEIIAGGESTHVEFKPAIWYNHTRALNDPNYSPGKDTNVSDNIVRTVAGFLNAEGGSLFIGVSDAGDAYGIENDIALTRRKDHDGLENELTQLLSNAVSVEIVATKVTVSLPTFQKKVIARVDVKRANSPVYMKTERHKDKFYVRVNNATEPFSLETAMNYIAMHDWKREDE